MTPRTLPLGRAVAALVAGAAVAAGALGIPGSAEPARLGAAHAHAAPAHAATSIAAAELPLAPPARTGALDPGIAFDLRTADAILVDAGAAPEILREASRLSAELAAAGLVSDGVATRADGGELAVAAGAPLPVGEAAPGALASAIELRIAPCDAAGPAEDQTPASSAPSAGPISTSLAATATTDANANAATLDLALDDPSLLAVSESGVRIEACDATGLLRGTRALLQLAHASAAGAIPDLAGTRSGTGTGTGTGSGTGTGTGVVPGAAAQPSARFPAGPLPLPTGVIGLGFDATTRSVHLDVARKPYSLASIQRLLREMSWSGLNELELHVSEFEGFRLESERHPEIVSRPAISKAQLRELIALARDLGIRITPSLDMPGHLEHALEAHPELRLRTGSGGAVYGALDITTPEGMAFAVELVDEYAELFEPGAWNLGADEFVDFGDADEVAALTASARERFGPSATAYDALTAFVNEMAAHLRERGFSARVWSDGMLRASVVALDPAVEIAHWTQRPSGAVTADRFAAAGHALLNVNDEHLYFVLGERVGYRYPTGESVFEGWRPTRFAGDVELPASPRLAGGMFAIWSDIPDALGDEEVVDRALPGIRSMAFRLADGSSRDAAASPHAASPGWPALEARLAAIGPAPAAVDRPAAGVPSLDPALLAAAPEPTQEAPVQPNLPQREPALGAILGAVLAVALLAGALLGRRARAVRQAAVLAVTDPASPRQAGEERP